MDKYKGKPLFITFEGCEGSGKTTQISLFCEYLSSKGIEFVKTREIGGTHEAESIRGLALNLELSPLSELALFLAARIEHLNKLIRPALESGKWVICDRFIDSTAAYQGFAQNLGIDFVYGIHSSFNVLYPPDITFFMDIPPEISLARARSRGGNNKFEEKDFDFHKKVYEGFKIIEKKFPERIVNIDASIPEPKRILEFLTKKI